MAGKRWFGRPCCTTCHNRTMDKLVEKQDEQVVEQSNETQAVKTMSRIVKPRVDIIEKDESYVVMADMAGVSAETVDVSLERNLLTLHGSDEARDLMYQRAFTLSKKIDRDGIEAEVKHGVVTVTLPKAIEVMPEKLQIAVKAG